MEARDLQDPRDVRATEEPREILDHRALLVSTVMLGKKEVVVILASKVPEEAQVLPELQVDLDHRDLRDSKEHLVQMELEVWLVPMDLLAQLGMLDLKVWVEIWDQEVLRETRVLKDYEEMMVHLERTAILDLLDLQDQMGKMDQMERKGHLDLLDLMENKDTGVLLVILALLDQLELQAIKVTMVFQDREEKMDHAAHGERLASLELMVPQVLWDLRV